MNSLTDVYNQVASKDAELEKQAAELIKQAEEEDAAGRIMARGFADELNKIAGGEVPQMANPATGPQGGQFKGDTGGTIKSKPGFDMGGAGKTGDNFGLGKRKPNASANAASLAGGSSKNPVGANPGSGAPKPPKPAAPQVAASGGAPKPPKI